METLTVAIWLQMAVVQAQCKIPNLYFIHSQSIN